MGKSYECHPPPPQWRRENRCHMLESVSIDLENVQMERMTKGGENRILRLSQSLLDDTRKLFFSSQKNAYTF